LDSCSTSVQPTNNQEPITNNHKPIKERATVVATPIGVSEIVWQDFKNHRKAKKAQVTQRVVDEIAKQAMLAGWSLQDALQETVVRNWQTFKAEWVSVKQNSLSKTGQMNQNVMSGLTRGLIGGGNNVKFIEG
jgi:hypothetical protein